MVLFILAAASGFSWALTVAYLPQRLVDLLHGINDNTALFMIGSIALLIVIGSVLEGLPALIILAPLLLPIAGGIGMSELHYGIVLLIAMGIGAFLPPAGVGFYVSCAIMRTDIEGAVARHAALPGGAGHRAADRGVRAVVHGVSAAGAGHRRLRAW